MKIHVKNMKNHEKSRKNMKKHQAGELRHLDRSVADGAAHNPNRRILRRSVRPDASRHCTGGRGPWGAASRHCTGGRGEGPKGGS